MTATARGSRRALRRLRQLPGVLGVSVRRISWGNVAGCVAAALLLTWLVTAREGTPDGHAVVVLRWAAVLLAAAVASVLDDPTEDDLAGVPTPVWWRRSVAVLVVSVPVALAWIGVLALPDADLPWGALTLEAVALIVLGTAVASLRRLRGSSAPAGLIAVAPPAALLLVASFLPTRLALYAAPQDTTAWRAAHLRWALVAVLAAVVLAAAARDRARRSPLRVARPARPRPTTSTATITPAATRAPALHTPVNGPSHTRSETP